MTNQNFLDKSVGEIVANDFRTAGIFKNAGIDFCCGGKKSVAESCNEKNIDADKLIAELLDVEQIPQNQAHNFKEWDLDFLCDYIAKTHHRYVQKTMPEILFYQKKLAQVHGGNHPELIAIASMFSKINDELSQHLKNEDEVLFPAIKEVLKSNSATSKAVIKSEIARMSGEHEFAGGAMDRINEISQHYKVPSDGCNTYHAGFKLLNQFEDDLHIHVHLENNILYPKALLLAE